uniref:Uncharacterized protein n=1 Tax=Myotis myotis TaxID=51298 RepID=A0A7J7SQ04_MYOMY|nr:hypothetical protein mMyoMyo1_002404 [Myotis myotis]
MKMSTTRQAGAARLERYNPELNTLPDSTPGAGELFYIIPGATAGLPCVRTRRLFWESVQRMTPYEST